MKSNRSPKMKNLRFDSEKELNEYLARARSPRRSDPAVPPYSDSPTAGHALPKPEYDSKFEAAYAQNLIYRQLAGEIILWRSHPLKFRLAKRTWFTPDFLVITEQGLEVHEVKGFMRDDANVKLKTCAEMYPWFRWFLVRRPAINVWVVKEVGK